MIGSLAALGSARLVMEDRSVRSALDALPAGQRAIVVSWGGLDRDRQAHDLPARRALRTVTRREPDAIVLFRETRLGGAIADVGALSGLADRIELTSGRLPGPCTASACEALRLAGPDVGAIPGVRITGTARLLDIDPLAPFLASGETQHGAARVMVLSPDLDGLAAREEWQGIYRTYGWRLPVDRVHLWELDRLDRTTDDLAATLGTTDPGYTVSSPARALEPARATAHAAGRRLLLLGGTGIAVLLGFALLAGTRQRADLSRERERFAWAGATGAQGNLIVTAEVALATAAAFAPGLALGVGAGALAAAAAGEPAGEIVRHTALSATGVGLALVTALAAGIAVVGVVLRRPAPARAGRRAVGHLAVAVALLAAILLRGSVGAGDVTDHGGATTLLILPVLVALVATIAVVHGLVPLLRLLQHATTATPAVRLAVLSLARRPAAAATTAAFVAVALGLAIFAGIYRDSLHTAAREQAAFVTGADAILAEEGRAADIGRAALPGAVASVIRLSGTLPDRSFVTALGLPASAIAGLAGWRADFASASPRELGDAITPPAAVSINGVDVPRRARTMTVVARARGAPIVLEASVATATGDIVPIELGLLTPRRGTRLTAALPPAARGGTLFSLGFALTAGQALNLGHRDTGDAGGTGRDVATGAISRLRVAIDGRPVDLRTWVGSGGVDRHGTTIAYAVGRGALARLRAPQATDARPIPVIASPNVAARAGRAGTLVVTIEGESVPVRIARVARLFPGIVGREGADRAEARSFVVADGPTLGTALNTAFPGLGRPAERWLTLPAAASARIADHMPTGLRLTSRRAIEARLVGDPLAVGATWMLGAAAGVALLLALIGLVLAVTGDLRDEAGELADLESQGASPGTLRFHVMLRAAIVWLSGLVGGAATGAVLAALVTRFVGLTATGVASDPPLRSSIPWLSSSLLLLGVTAGAAVLVSAATVVATRERR